MLLSIYYYCIKLGVTLTQWASISVLSFYVQSVLSSQFVSSQVSYLQSWLLYTSVFLYPTKRPNHTEIPYKFIK